jgi:hypothetical protein
MCRLSGDTHVLRNNMTCNAIRLNILFKIQTRIDLVDIISVIQIAGRICKHESYRCWCNLLYCRQLTAINRYGAGLVTPAAVEVELLL